MLDCHDFIDGHELHRLWCPQGNRRELGAVANILGVQGLREAKFQGPQGLFFLQKVKQKEEEASEARAKEGENGGGEG